MAQENKNLNPENGAVDQTAPATSNVLNDDTRIVVEARVPAVYYTCPVTFETFSWLEVGDTQEMTYKQIKFMNVKHPRYFSDRWLKPLNDDVLERLKLKKYFENNLRRGDLKLLFGNDVAAVEEMLTNLNPDSKAELAQMAIKSAKDGVINNVKIIRLIEKHLGVEIMDLI